MGMKRTSSAWIGVVALTLCACGGQTNEAKAPDGAQDAPPAGAGDATDPSAADAPSDAEGQDGGANAPSDADTSAGGGDDTGGDPPKPGGDVIGKGDAAPDDACAQDAAPYEESLRPALNACYREAKKNDPELSGSIRIAVNIGADGRPKRVKQIPPSELPEKAIACMVAAVKKAPLTSKACRLKSITVQKSWGER